MTSNALNIFDRIYLINLEKRKDRLDKWFLNNKTIVEGLNNFEIIKAVEGKGLISEEFQGTIGALGCLESHLLILKDARSKGYRRILIFEDDFESIEDFHENFQKGWDSLPENWDMLYLFSSDHIAPIPYNDYLMRCSATLCTVAYAINSSAFTAMIDLLEKRLQPVDVVYGHLHFLIHAYKFKKNICEHDSGFSDVEDGYVDRDSSIKKRIISKFYYLKTKLFNENH